MTTPLCLPSASPHSSQVAWHCTHLIAMGNSENGPAACFVFRRRGSGPRRPSTRGGSGHTTPGLQGQSWDLTARISAPDVRAAKMARSTTRRRPLGVRHVLVMPSLGGYPLTVGFGARLSHLRPGVGARGPLSRRERVRVRVAGSLFRVLTSLTPALSQRERGPEPGASAPSGRWSEGGDRTMPQWKTVCEYPILASPTWLIVVNAGALPDAAQPYAGSPSRALYPQP